MGAGEVSWPASLKQVKPGDGVMQLRLRAHTGVGIGGMVCLGWCDTSDYHMIGVGAETSAMLTTGGHIFAGKHADGLSMRIFLGIGNFAFEYTFPLAQDTLGCNSTAVTDSVGNAGSNPAAVAATEEGNGLVVEPALPAVAPTAPLDHQPAAVEDYSIKKQ